MAHQGPIIPYQFEYLTWFESGGDSLIPSWDMALARAASLTDPLSVGGGSFPWNLSNALFTRLTAVASIAASPACGSPSGMRMERNRLKVFSPTQPVSSMSPWRCTPAIPDSPTFPPDFP